MYACVMLIPAYCMHLHLLCVLADVAYARAGSAACIGRVQRLRRRACMFGMCLAPSALQILAGDCQSRVRGLGLGTGRLQQLRRQGRMFGTCLAPRASRCARAAVGDGKHHVCTHCIIVTGVLARPRAVFWAPLLVRAILDEGVAAPDNGATGARPPCSFFGIGANPGQGCGPAKRLRAWCMPRPLCAATMLCSLKRPSARVPFLNCPTHGLLP